MGVEKVNDLIEERLPVLVPPPTTDRLYRRGKSDPGRTIGEKSDA
jgi:hypothetical protein